MEMYKYKEELFTRDSCLIIDYMISLNPDKEILDLATQINDIGTPVFSLDELQRIKSGVSYKLSARDIKLYAVNTDGHSLYNSYQMDEILCGLRGGFSVDEINIYARLDEKGDPMYDEEQMRALRAALVRHISVDDIMLLVESIENPKPLYDGFQMQQIVCGAELCPMIDIINLYGKLDENKNPIYSADQMYEIRMGLKDKIPLEYIEIFTKIKNDKPVFNDVEMCNLRSFIKLRNKNQIDQLKSFIKNNLTFTQIEPLLRDMPAENMRVLSSLYELGCEPDDVSFLVDEKLTYEELKEIKYLVQCAELLGIGFRDTFEYSKTGNFIINEFREDIAESALIYRNIYNAKSEEILEKCLSYKVPPEQIVYIADEANSWNHDKMKAVAIALLNGLTMEEIDVIKEENKKECNPLHNALANAVKEKFNDISNIDDEIYYKSNWFEKDEYDLEKEDGKNELSI